MSPQGRPKGEYRSAKREGNPMSEREKLRPEGRVRERLREADPRQHRVAACGAEADA